MKSRQESLALLSEYTSSASLIKHSLAVEAAMRWYANFFSQPPDETEKWGAAGLLHDFDYERHPDATPPDGHPYFGNRILLEHGYPEDMCRAIMGHATYSGVARDTLMAKTLFAVDELTGLIMASALIRPDKSISNLEVSSVKKKFKDKRFAAGCNRDDILLGTQELGIEMDDHIRNVIEAMRLIAGELELA